MKKILTLFLVTLSFCVFVVETKAEELQPIEIETNSNFQQSMKVIVVP